MCSRLHSNLFLTYTPPLNHFPHLPLQPSSFVLKGRSNVENRLYSLSLSLFLLLLDHFHVFDDDFSVKVLDADFSVLDFDHEDSVGVGDGDAIISDGHLLVDAVVLDPRVAFRDLDDVDPLDVF